MRAHILQADRWVRKGTPPPVSYHLKTTPANEIKRDASDNAITVNTSGQPVPRLPFVELGEARFVTGFAGSYDSVKSVADLGFGSHAAYLKAFKGKVAAYRAAGYIRPEEAAVMRARARLCPPLTFTETYRDHYDDFVSMQPCSG